MADRELAEAHFREGFKKILEGFELLGYDTSADENFQGTVSRAAKGLAELVLCNDTVQSEINDMLAKTFPARYDEMVISKHNVSFGVCPHHILPVIYRISVAYIPMEKVLGISKLSRLVQLLARRPILQEDLTHELARILHQTLESRGAAAYVEGMHLCMAARGVQAHEARVVTSAVRGAFLDQPATRQEFLDLVTTAHPSLL
ncbi:MAG: GTP cyclohydrolase I [Deltaproteobacteria bacterium]|nr:GTP cyclohydrolase I [Deltaproteobacteria bacterium]